MSTTISDHSSSHSENGNSIVPQDEPTKPVREIDSDTLNRLRLMQLELVEATNTAQLLQQVKDLKQERFQLFLELAAAHRGIDLQREEIRLSDGRILVRP